jgi:hypothetical protein
VRIILRHKFTVKKVYFTLRVLDETSVMRDNALLTAGQLRWVVSNAM